MYLAVFESFGLIFLLKMMNVFVSLCSSWSHHHLDLRLGRVYGVRVRRRGVGGVHAGEHREEDVEAGQHGQGEDVV